MFREITTPTFHFNSKYSLLELSCTLARLCQGTPLQPLRLDFFGINFPSRPWSQLPFLTFSGQDNKGKGAQIPRAFYAPQIIHPRDIVPQTISHLSTAKVSSILCHTIPCHCAPLEESFTCVYQNHFSMHSPCSSFTISLKGEGRRCSNDNVGRDGTSATAPCPVGQRGEGSP